MRRADISLIKAAFAKVSELENDFNEGSLGHRIHAAFQAGGLSKEFEALKSEKDFRADFEKYGKFSERLPNLVTGWANMVIMPQLEKGTIGESDLLKWTENIETYQTQYLAPFVEEVNRRSEEFEKYGEDFKKVKNAANNLPEALDDLIAVVKHYISIRPETKKRRR